MQRLAGLPKKVFKKKFRENKWEEYKKLVNQDIFHGCFQRKIVVAYYEALMSKTGDRRLLSV